MPTTGVQRNTVRPESKRIVVLGCSGVGKSTFARRLGAILGIDVFHLDVYFWRPGWVESDPAEFERAVRSIMQHDAWIIEGNYNITGDTRLEASDTIIYLSESGWRCALRFIRRCWFDRSRPDLPAGCQEALLNKAVIRHIRFILNFQRDRGPRLLELVQKYRGVKRVHKLDGRHQVDAFIECVRTSVS